ncbi:D-2-hydroxyacid dehydrogenase [Aliikangiella coralliicola]|uniref:D-2-hydroxyacid dehydrogenase n=1 Tax=Aliikangiella coralliicola TaxID=2592383 RepID=A0A545UEA5_9GAMM|nr:D-2-hydroxyacid dehydrogenase [Aliikangiella coralliicola]TQV87817.1 D-2-hydroxyacid dehydrogenase [Aliikangiella coralliicola]
MKAVFLDYATIDKSIDFSCVHNAVDELVFFSHTTNSEIVDKAKSADIVLTNKVELDAACLAQLPNLKLICVTATGTNNVDLIAAKKHNIAVTNVSGYSTQSVAQHIFAYLLNVVNNVEFYLGNNRRRPWHQSQTFCQIDAPINELSGKTLGILGFGNLGAAVAKLAEAFAMKIVISERPGATNVRAGRIAFEEMLATADVVSVHCPLTEDTKSLFNQKTFDQMKRGSIFINTARGPIVDSDALVSSLKSKHIAHAIIDVLDNEPPEIDHPLLKNDIPNLTLTHHIAWGSMQAQQRLIDGVADNIQSFLGGEKLNRVEG